MRKVKKLVKDPDRFFFDLFAKRLAQRRVGHARPSTGTSEGLIAVQDSIGDDASTEMHPFLKVARRFGLRSGATSGRSDQSLLVDSAELGDVLAFLFLVAHGLKSGVRVWSPLTDFVLTIEGSLLLDRRKVESIHAAVHGLPNFNVELLGEFEGNFVSQIYLHDTDATGLVIVRTPRAFIRKATSGAFERLYPLPMEVEGNWSFHTPYPIDIVYTYVNKDDRSWQKLWAATYPDQHLDNDRYASKDELRFSLRALCKNLPWFRHVYIVSNCERPGWLKDHPRLHWVCHEDIFPDPSVLPTFNSHAIEACLHRIPGLEERFIYFNDDFFVAAPCSFADFFDTADHTIAQFESYGMVHDDTPGAVTSDYLRAAINASRCLSELFPSYCATRLHKHTPYALKRSLLQEIEERLPQDFERTRSARRRSAGDINIPSFLFHHYAIASGHAVEGDAPSMFVRPQSIEGLLDRSHVGDRKFLCFNDGDGSADDRRYIGRFKSLMERTFPTRSPFELDSGSGRGISTSVAAACPHRQPSRARHGVAPVDCTSDCAGLRDVVQ
jgi:hypothetical protein